MWFDVQCVSNNNKPIRNECRHGEHGFLHNTCVTREQWIQSCKTHNISTFYFAIQCFIDFKFLRDIQLYYLNHAIHEDHNFGLMLTLQCKNIYILGESLYFNCLQPNSTTRFDSKNPHIVPYCKPIYEAFGDAKLAKQYHIAGSWFLMLLELLEFLKERPQEEREFVEQYFISHYIHQSLKLFSFTKDPLNLLSRIHAIEPKKGFRYRYRVRLESVEKYKLMYPLFRCYDCIRSIERTLRRLVKGKKW